MSISTQQADTQGTSSSRGCEEGRKELSEVEAEGTANKVEAEGAEGTEGTEGTREDIEEDE